MDTLNTNDCLQSSTDLKNFIEREGQLPNYVKISESIYLMEEYMYISSRFIFAICLAGSNAIASDFKRVGVDNPKITPIKANIDKATFCDMNNRVADYFIQNDRAPSYVSSEYGNVQFQAHIYANAKILDFYKKNKVLPNYVSLNLDANSKILTYLPKITPEDVTTLCGGLEMDSLNAVNDEAKLSLTVLCDQILFMIELSVADKVKLLNNVDKVDVRIEGYKPITFKKPDKGWKITNDRNPAFKKSFTVKGKPEDIAWEKNYSFEFYDRKNKLLGSKKGKVMINPLSGVTFNTPIGFTFNLGEYNPKYHIAFTKDNSKIIIEPISSHSAKKMLKDL